MSDLPSLSEQDAVAQSPTLLAAYSRILTLEEAVRRDHDPRKLIYARILGRLMLHGPSAHARLAVAQELLSRVHEDALLTSGKVYNDHLIRRFKKVERSILSPTLDTSPPSFDTHEAMVRDMLMEAPQTIPKPNEMDGFRCVVTGEYDLVSVDKNLELQKIVDGELQSVTATNCAHVFPESMTENVSDNDGYATSIWEIMDRFGYPNIARELNGPDIHRLKNVLTLCIDVRTKFDALRLWFEPTENAGTYTVEAVHPRYLGFYYKRTVTFTTPDEEKLPVPSPEYLEIHAACAKVAHLSGAGEYIDKVLREIEDAGVLSKDGASAEALEHAPLSTSDDVASRFSYVHSSYLEDPKLNDGFDY